MRRRAAAVPAVLLLQQLLQGARLFFVTRWLGVSRDSRAYSMPARGTGLNGVSVRENGATNRLPLMALAGGNATARRASPVLSASTRGLRDRVEELNVGRA